MRNDIHDVLTTFAHLPGNPMTDAGIQYLERELLIVMSTPEVERRAQALIDRSISSLRKALADDPDPQAYLGKLLDNSAIPYLEQKMIQNIAAYIYRAGFKRGKSHPSESHEIR